ncbi:MAG TPA: hypothetical protein VE844_09310, partial [Gammaproteobacteria bacterium]|nr:hypothetical protein [Gammaproteobacteria bacterium]
MGLQFGIVGGEKTSGRQRFEGLRELLRTLQNGIVLTPKRTGFEQAIEIIIQTDHLLAQPGEMVF